MIKEENNVDIIKSIEHEQLKNKIPELKIGDTVRVHVRIKEGNKERIQVFEGIIIKKQGGGVIRWSDEHQAFYISVF